MCVVQALQSQGISHVVQLEQWLMEGAYNKVLDARPKLPDPAYGYFMEKLLSTVRCGAVVMQQRIGTSFASSIIVQRQCKRLVGRKGCLML
jgi:hypothetical protein